MTYLTGLMKGFTLVIPCLMFVGITPALAELECAEIQGITWEFKDVINNKDLASSRADSVSVIARCYLATYPDTAAMLLNYQAYLLIQARRLRDARQIIEAFFSGILIDTLAAPASVMAEMYFRKGFIEDKLGNLEGMLRADRNAARYSHALNPKYAAYLRLGTVWGLHARRAFREADKILTSITKQARDSSYQDILAQALAKRAIGMLGLCESPWPWSRRGCDVARGYGDASQAAALFEELGDVRRAIDARITEAQLRAAQNETRSEAISIAEDVLLKSEENGDADLRAEASELLNSLRESTFWRRETDRWQRIGLVLVVFASLGALAWKLIAPSFLLGGFLTTVPRKQNNLSVSVDNGIIYIHKGDEDDALPVLSLMASGHSNLEQLAPHLRAIRLHVDEHAGGHCEYLVFGLDPVSERVISFIVEERSLVSELPPGVVPSGWKNER